MGRKPPDKHSPRIQKDTGQMFYRQPQLFSAAPDKSKSTNK